MERVQWLITLRKGTSGAVLSQQVQDQVGIRVVLLEGQELNGLQQFAMGALMMSSDLFLQKEKFGSASQMG